MEILPLFLEKHSDRVSVEQLKRKVVTIAVVLSLISSVVLVGVAVKFLERATARHALFTSAAVAAGPITLLSKRAVQLAQADLDEMMLNLQKEVPLLEKVSVVGGPAEQRETFLSWSIRKPSVIPFCPSELSKNVSPEVALFPFEIKVTTNRCKAFFFYSAVWLPPFLLILLSVTLAVGFFLRESNSLLNSIRLATSSLDSSDRELIQRISLDEVRHLALKALDARRAAALQRSLEVSEQVIHDIRSPLSLLKVLSASLNQLDENEVEGARGAIRRISEIVDSLKKKASKGKITDIREAIDVSVEHKLLETQKGPHFIGTDFATDQKLHASVNPLEFSRFLSNVMNNAVEANATRVEIAARRVGEGSTIEVSVRDNGSGMSQDLVDKLEKSKKSTKTDGVHSGLGLLHARQMAQESGGAFRIKSDLGAGTVITVTLPSVHGV